MSNIDKRALREAAEKATKGQWAVEFDDEIYSTDGVNHEQIAMVFSENEARDAAFIAAANPTTVLALLDELEAAGKRIIELEQKCENDPRIHEIIDLKERIAGLEAEKAELRQVEPDGWITDSDKWEKEGVAAAYKKLFRESPIPQDIPFYFAKPQSAAAGIGKGE